MTDIHISLPQIVGKGYGTFWHYQGRYRVVKGSRASKKSKTAALNFIYRMMLYPEANLLVVRKTFRTLKDSCFTELKWAIQRLGVEHHWGCKESPLEFTYKPTGQKIYFRGLDDPLKVTSITVEMGCLCWLWVEEAYEITSEKAFDMLDESIRGEVPQGLFKQITLTFNPWNEHHWLKARFFDAPDPDTLAITTNYLCNEWLDNADQQFFQRMKETNPRRYQVAGLGNWGIAQGLVFDKWLEEAFDYDLVRMRPGIKAIFGLDFGYATDPAALFCGLYLASEKQLYVFDEIYDHGLSNEALFQRINQSGYRKEVIRADSAEPKSIDRLRTLGIPRVTPSYKGPDSVRNGIDFIQDLTLVIHPRCVNFLREVANYTWKTDPRTGRTLNVPEDDFNHLMDAMRYACEGITQGRLGFARVTPNLRRNYPC